MAASSLPEVEQPEPGPSALPDYDADLLTGIERSTNSRPVAVMVNNIANSAASERPPPAGHRQRPTCSSRRRSRAASPACVPCSATLTASPRSAPSARAATSSSSCSCPVEYPLLPRRREHLLHPVRQCVRLLRAEHRRQELLQHPHPPHRLLIETTAAGTLPTSTPSSPPAMRSAKPPLMPRSASTLPARAPSSTSPTTAPTR